MTACQPRAKHPALWLALFAALLIVVAPLVSVSLRAPPITLVNMSTASMPGIICHGNASLPTSVETGPDGMASEHLPACGYCLLLAHLPGLLLCAALLLSGWLRQTRIKYSPQRQRRRCNLRWLYPHPRAPPTLAGGFLQQ